ncbi:MAG TPA: SusC/RagA family TonB-linked outer membrane protein [Niastella sp.]
MHKTIVNKWLFVLATTALLMLYFDTHAQTPVTIKGKVTENGSGDAIGGVTIVEVNENDRQVNGANTDISGNYTIRVSNPANRLRFSFIGFETKTEPVGNRAVINVKLARDSGQSMSDVIVLARKGDQVSNGFGSTSKRDLIGAVSSVKGEVLQDQPATSIDQMLQGRAAGVQIVTNSGDPGAGVDIRIRGAGSISGGNEPLYIVDGVPIISTPFDNSAGGQNVARINPIADINPSDIERIDILKDANAAAIYGARAANGVILITTKRGNKGKTDITLKSQFSLQEAVPSIPVLNGTQYKIMRLEALQNAGNINPSSSELLPLVDDPSYAAYQYYQNNTDWMKALKQTGFAQVHNLSVAGGGEAMRYNFSTSYTDNKGSFINTGTKRFTTRFNLDYKVSNKLKFSANIAFTRSKINNHANAYGQGTVYYLGHVRSSALPIYDIDTNGNQLPNYFSLPGPHGGMDNPVAFANTVSNDAYSTNLKPNIRAELDITKGLKYISNASLDYMGENSLTYLPPEATGLIWNDRSFNRVDTRDYERMQMILDNLLVYYKNLTPKLKGSFVLGNTFNTFVSSQLLASAYASASGSLRTLGTTGGNRQLVSNKTTETILSVFAKADLIYNDRYGFNVTVRRDGSSKFGRNNKYANFPSVGGYWRASAEPFLADLPFLTDLKFRASWGQLGNSGIPNYAYISQFMAGSNYMGNSGVSQTNPALNNLRWETSESTNLGMDLDLFKSRVVITLDVYDKLTKDLLFNLPVPSTSGVVGGWNLNNQNGSILTNLGNISNRGVEVDVLVNAIRAKKAGDFSWTMSFNVGRNINKVTSLPGGTLKLTENYANFGSQVKQGDALGTYYGLVFKGVYATDGDAVVRDAKGNMVYDLDGKSPRKMRVLSENGDTLRGGDAIYEDFNNDGIINDQDKILIGNANADFFGGFSNEFRYKNFGFKFFIQFQYGNDVINGMRYYLERMMTADNQAITTMKRWRKQGDVTDMPRALNGDQRNSQGSTRWIEDGSYARLKFVTLTYTFPRTWIQKIKLKGVDAFFTANDLFAWTDYTGADPEISLSSFGNNPALIGVDRGLTPRSRGYTIGINARF